MTAIIFCDGASNPKTQRSGIGAVWFAEDQFVDPNDGKTLHTDAKFFMSLSREIFGSKSKHTYPTNNDAEYISLIGALEQSIEHGIQCVIVYMDSKLVVNQVNNKWNINFPHLQELKNQVDALRGKIQAKVVHIRREWNTHADIESKNCIAPKPTTQLTNTTNTLPIKKPKKGVQTTFATKSTQTTLF
jgi:ribonuclease HI